MGSIENNDLFVEYDSDSLAAFDAAVHEADLVYIKKLALNDWQWAESPNAHQGGFYVPQSDRDSGFFPPLSEKFRPQGGMPIYEVWFDVVWPQAGGEIKEARLVNYSSKGEETHLTNVVKAPFRGISPASLVLMGRRMSRDGNVIFTALVADSASQAADYLRNTFNLSSDFHSGFFEPAVIVKETKNKALSFLESALEAWRLDKLDEFAKSIAALPKPKELARRAQEIYLEACGRTNLSPFELDEPGNSIMRISRDIEFNLFKEYELQARSLELVKIIFGFDRSTMTIEKAITSIIDQFPQIDKILLSAAQQRKSRAGKSFELHIERLLTDGGISHEVQVVIESKKRPDFVLPNYKTYQDPHRTKQQALVLSAKTTLRERWKQVHAEIKNCDLYLATVDENITESAIDDMADSGIFLVVPEVLKYSNTTVYRKKNNVLSFKNYFEQEIKNNRMPLWN